MATISVSLLRVSNRAEGGMVMPVAKSVAEASQSIASSGTSQASTIVAPAEAGGGTVFWRIVPLGNIWVTFGAAPTAAAGTTFLVPANTIAEFSAVEGHKVALIDAV